MFKRLLVIIAATGIAYLPFALVSNLYNPLEWGGLEVFFSGVMILLLIRLYINLVADDKPKKTKSSWGAQILYHNELWYIEEADKVGEIFITLDKNLAKTFDTLPELHKYLENVRTSWVSLRIDK